MPSRVVAATNAQLSLLVRHASRLRGPHGKIWEQALMEIDQSGVALQNRMRLLPGEIVLPAVRDTREYLLSDIHARKHTDDSRFQGLFQAATCVSVLPRSSMAAYVLQDPKGDGALGTMVTHFRECEVWIRAGQLIALHTTTPSRVILRDDFHNVLCYPGGTVSIWHDEDAGWTRGDGPYGGRNFRAGTKVFSPCA